MSTEETKQSWIEHGDYAFSQSNFAEALTCYSKGLQQDPTNVLLLSKVGNAYFSMQQTTAAEHFYWQAFSISNAITVIYEYVLVPEQTRNLSILQVYLHDHLNVSITVEGLDYMINTLYQEIQEQPPPPPMNHKQSKPFEKLVTTLLHHAGIPFSQNLFDVVHQIQQTFLEPSRGTHRMILSKRMSWMQLEEFFYQFFQNQGYHVTKTKKSHDQGVDLLLKSDTEFIAVQIKKRAKPIGIRGVQEIHTGGVFYGTNRAVLISTSGFTRSALKLADKVMVECWDWQQILQEFHTHQQPLPTDQNQDQPIQG